MLRHCVMQAPRSAGPRAISDGGLKGDVGAPPSPVLPNSPLPSEPPSSVPRCDVKPNIHVLGDDTGIPGMELSVQLNMNGMPAAHPCMHDADMLCLAASNLSASVPFEPPREEEVDDKEEAAAAPPAVHSGLFGFPGKKVQSTLSAALPMERHCMTHAACVLGRWLNQYG